MQNKLNKITNKIGLPEIPRFKRRTVADDIAQYIRELLLNGQFSPGQKLIEEEFCEKFNVSRTPIREAFRILQTEGLLIASRSRGVTVPTLTKQDLADVWIVRYTLEGLAVQEACKKITREELSTLKATVAVAEALSNNDADNKEALFKANTEFHETIIMATKNKWLIEYIMKIWTQIHLKFLLRYCFIGAGHTQKSIDEHKAIISAIESDNAQLARQLMEQHIYSSEETIAKYVSDEL